ncbi:histidine kinase [Lacisediminihabitans sp. H27-G8]|uniref:histidine kinase n=1 Tax=Lacisediminihabitans sp. H27-G8 TaxID=3111909 RepID=UPI0038FC58F8
MLVQYKQSQEAKIAQAVQADRLRIASNLHDLVRQDLFGLALALHTVATQLPDCTLTQAIRDSVEEIDDADYVKLTWSQTLFLRYVNPCSIRRV